MINLHKIWLEGFGSYIQETKFKLDRPGFNIIIAKNGVGKTSTFSGVRWVLYGTSLKSKDVQTFEWLRPKDFKGTRVRLIFSDEHNKYEVIRCQDYLGKVDGAKGGSRLSLIINGVKCPKRNKVEIQAEINKIVGYSDKLFMNAILFGQKMKRLIEETGPDQKKVFDEAFETQFIKDGKDKADKKIKELKPNFNEADKKLITVQKDIEIIRNGILAFKEARVRWMKDTTSKIKRFDEGIEDSELELKKAKKSLKKLDITDLYNQLAEINDKLKQSSSQKIKELESKAFKEQLQLTSMEGRVDDFNLEIDTLKEAFMKVKKNCPICGGKLSPENIKKEQGRIKEKIRNIKEKIPKQLEIISDQKNALGILEDKIASLKENKDNIIELESLKKDYESKITKHATYTSTINHITKKLKGLYADREEAKNSKFDMEDKGYFKKLKKLKKQRADIKILYRGIKEELEDLTWISNEVLSNKGLKSYIFDTSLRNLNNHLRYYEQFIGWRVEFQIDFDSANKDIYALCYQGDNMTYYENLSGGQQQLINISTAFALNDMTTANKPINLLVLDEVFEGLDNDNVDIVNDLIREKSHGKCLYLITHNIDLQSSGDKVIRMKMQNGQTILKSL